MDGLRVHIDKVISFDKVFSPKGFSRELSISGWCITKSLQVANDLWAFTSDSEAPCLTGIPRPDVAADFKNPELVNSGFICRLPFPRASTGMTFRPGPGPSNEAFDWNPASAGVRGEDGCAGPYGQWLARTESHMLESSRQTRLCLKKAKSLPAISIILPTFNTALYYLHRCIGSVVSQIYPNWELCVADDNSSDPRVRLYIEDWMKRDSRIHCVFRAHQGGISAASNTAIERARGEFIVLLDHDDELHPLALLELMERLQCAPEAELIYTDEDKIDLYGKRKDPSFKPPFDADLLTSFDYIGHLICLKKQLVESVGGFRSETDGSQDWDLLLRAAEKTDPCRIHHVPKPLYHWRMHEDSTAMRIDAKPYVFRAWDRVLQDHVARRCVTAIIESGLFTGSMRLRRKTGEQTRVAILCRASDGRHQERALRRAWLPVKTRLFEVFLSVIRPLEGSQSPDCTILTVEDLCADVLIFVNCAFDSVNHQFIDELAGQALREDCGLVSGTVAAPNGRVISAGLAYSDGAIVNPFEDLPLSAPGYMGQALVVRSVPSLSSQFFALRSELLHTVGGLARVSEDGLDGLCVSLVTSAHAAGLKVLFTPYAVATLRAECNDHVHELCSPPPAHLILNRNLQDFGKVGDVLKRGIQ